MSGDGTSVLESAWGAGCILVALATPFLRGRRLRWGARDHEQQRTFPGDELVPEPRWQYLHAVSVRTPPALVWPWIAQLGQGRGGFYSYELLENLVGCRIQNAFAVIPDLQRVSVGDPVSIHPKVPPLRVAHVEPGHALVLHSRADPASGRDSGRGDGAVAANLSWAFVVEEAEAGRSRLFSRYRVEHGPGWGRALAYGPWLLEPFSHVMDLKMLAGIRWRAEEAAGHA